MSATPQLGSHSGQDAIDNFADQLASAMVPPILECVYVQFPPKENVVEKDASQNSKAAALAVRSKGGSVSTQTTASKLCQEVRTLRESFPCLTLTSWRE